MQNIEDFKNEIIAFASSLNSDILLPKISRVSVEPLDQVISLDLASEELSAFNLPRQYVYGKIVRLPSNFKPQQELHFGADQLTGVITGQLIWVQGNDAAVRTVLSKSMVMHTPANIWHGHATNNEPVILVAVFTSHNPPKDRTRDLDWTNYL